MVKKEKAGLKYWMTRVGAECRRAGQDLDPEAVHDLRVALRRCRSMADAFLELDPQPAWRQMKREGKKLFRSLGELRDVQVMLVWVQRLCPETDEAARAMKLHLAENEQRSKANALKALRSFDLLRWNSWCEELALRAGRVPAGGRTFQHLALERWQEARELHFRALRNRSDTAFHQLRVGLKRFRYTVENFLPRRRRAWEAGLRELQDLLGERHDLFVLRRTALKIGALRDPVIRARWNVRIEQERRRRLARYREAATGRKSVWQEWRTGLPAGKGIRQAVLARLVAWTAYRDPEISHARHVCVLALQLFGGLRKCRLEGFPAAAEERFILQMAAWMHDVGRFRGERKHHKASGRMMRDLMPLHGLDAASLFQASLVARYHRGALPGSGHKRYAALSPDVRRRVRVLSGILRLANCFDASHDRRVIRLVVDRTAGGLRVQAENYDPEGYLGQRVACARHLLEVSCGLPVWVAGVTPPALAAVEEQSKST